MCLIISRPAGIDIPKDLLEQSVMDNPDGWGIMFATNGKLHVEKGMAKQGYLNAAALIPKDTAALLHTRYVSAGSKALYNTHPFRINADVALMHNGTLEIDRNFIEMSDTWHFSFKIMGPMLKRRPQVFGDDRLEKLLGHAIGEDNKLALMRSDGKTMIVNRDQGQEYKGLWLSNGRSLYGQAFGDNTWYENYRANNRMEVWSGNRFDDNVDHTYINNGGYVDGIRYEPNEWVPGHWDANARKYYAGYPKATRVKEVVSQGATQFPHYDPTKQVFVYPGEHTTPVTSLVPQNQYQGTEMVL